MAGSRARLRSFDADAVAAANADGDTPVRAVCDEHGLGWTTLYRLLDEHHTPRRPSEQSPRRIPETVEEEIARAIRQGERLQDITARLSVSQDTVGNVRCRHYGPLVPGRRHEELVDLIVRWLFDGGLSDSEVDAIGRCGVVVTLAGFQSIQHIHPELRTAVVQRVVKVVAARWAIR